MYVTHYTTREEKTIDMMGASGTSIRWLVGCHDGASKHVMRMFTIRPNGVIPLHTHDEEHQIFVLSGEAQILGTEMTAKEGDVVYIQSNNPHGFRPLSNDSFVFLCTIPLLRDK